MAYYKDKKEKEFYNSGEGNNSASASDTPEGQKAPLSSQSQGGSYSGGMGTSSSRNTNTSSSAPYLRGVDNLTSDTLTKSYVPSETVNSANAYLEAMRQNGYNNKWADSLDNMVDQYLTRGEFSYDLDSDVLFENAKNSAMRQGALAMEDTSAYLSSLTGGYGNSYAATAGNQAYQNYLDALYDSAPEYYKAAYDAYRDEGDQMLNNISLLQSMDDSEYARWADEYNRAVDYADMVYNRDYGQFADNRNAAFNLASMENSDYWAGTEFDENVRQYNQNFAYQKERDAVSDAQFNANLAEEQRQFNEELGYQKEQDAAALAAAADEQAEFVPFTSSFINDKLGYDGAKQLLYESGLSDEDVNGLLSKQEFQTIYESKGEGYDDVIYFIQNYGYDNSNPALLWNPFKQTTAAIDNAYRAYLTKYVNGKLEAARQKKE